MQSIKIGLLGFGTVGRGAYNVLRRNQQELTRRAGRGIRITHAAARQYDPARIEGLDQIGRISDDAFAVVDDPEVVIVDFAASRVVDQSALQAIETIAARYEAAGKRIMLRHLSRDCHRLLAKAGHLMVDSDDDPDYELAVDYGVRTGILGAGH